jgi:hypothetical protein
MTPQVFRDVIAKIKASPRKPKQTPAIMARISSLEELARDAK